MNLLHELWDLGDYLAESAGNLRVLSPKMFNAIKDNVDYYAKRDADHQGKSYVPNKNLPNDIGHDSVVKSEEEKTFKDLFDNIADDTVRVFVLEANGAQFLSGVKLLPSNIRASNNIDIVMYLDATELHQKIVTDKQKAIEFKYELDQTRLKEDDHCLTSLNNWEFGHALNTLFKFCNEVGYPITLITVHIDPNRAKTRLKRRISTTISNYKVDSEQRETSLSPPVRHPMQSADSFEREAKHLLKRRLDQFKRDKAANVTSPEEMLEQIKTAGWLDYIKIMGVLYELDEGGSNLDFGSLVKHKRDKNLDLESRHNYLLYKVVRGDPGYKKMKDNLESLRDLADGDEEYEELRDKYELPRRIKVHLKLENGGIVPDLVDVDKFYNITQ